MSIFSRRIAHTPENASSGEVIQEPKDVPLGYLRAKRLDRSMTLRRGEAAFTNRALAKRLDITESTIRRIRGGERPLAEHHYDALPPSLKEDVEQGTPSERKLLASSGIRRRP